MVSKKIIIVRIVRRSK